MSIAPPSDANPLSLLMADAKAFVFDVIPSPTPPKSVNTALCFRQFSAENTMLSGGIVFGVHSATCRHNARPNNKNVVDIISITCKQKRKIHIREIRIFRFADDIREKRKAKTFLENPISKKTNNIYKKLIN